MEGNWNLSEKIKLMYNNPDYRDSFRILEDYYRIFDDIDKLAGKSLV
jgi:hypothetical protein